MHEKAGKPSILFPLSRLRERPGEGLLSFLFSFSARYADRRRKKILIQAFSRRREKASEKAIASQPAPGRRRGYDGLLP
jgi:hypothetical protein